MTTSSNTACSACRSLQPTAQTVTPDFLFVPLVAFDQQGGRIGYGAGHYDATLTALHARSRVKTAGLAYAIQEIETVPHEAHDQRLDFVITQDRVFTGTP